MRSNVEKQEGAVQRLIRGKKAKWLLVLLPVVAVAVVIGVIIKSLSGSVMSTSELEMLLAQEESTTIHINGIVKLDREIVVSGQKTLTGNGTIVPAETLNIEWPVEEKSANSWGMGCASLELQDTDAMKAILTVSDGAELIIGGSVTIDANQQENAIYVAENSSLKIEKDAQVLNGRYANVVIAQSAKAEITGGSIQNSQVHGIINAGTLDFSGGKIAESKFGANIYSVGQTTHSGGTITDAGVHNVYVAEGAFTMKGGTNSGAAKDAILVRDGARAEIQTGTISGCVHGLCNNGDMTVGALTLNECGIMNYEHGNLTLNGTAVDTAAVYCLANNGGVVKAQDFSALNCDVCAVYNFSGDMELTNLKISGSRDGNIANGGGNLTVDGAVLEKCRDKSVIVGGGKAVLNNVTIAGTSKEKYGVYAFGGELYMRDATAYDIDSTAFKADAGAYIQVNNVSIKDIAQNGFHSDGGRIVAENVTMENLGSHGIYNNSGDIEVTDLNIAGVQKNVLQQKGGRTVLKKMEADSIGNHGTYIESGSVEITDSTLMNIQGCGLYLVTGESEAVLKNVVIDNVQKQGINNSSKVTADNLTIRNVVQNGIFNKEGGLLTAGRVIISNVGEHGINNAASMTISDVTVTNTGAEKNSVQNSGTLVISDAALKGSKNHGIYNEGTISGKTVTIEGTASAGIYNANGNIDAISGLVIDSTGSHGINNAASMTVSGVTITNTGAEKNSVQNSGTLVISDAALKGSKNHGIYNEGAISGKTVTIEGTASAGIYNAKGNIDAISGLVIDGTGSHGINNMASMTVSEVTITNTGAEKNSVQNSGTLVISNATLKGSKNHGIYNEGTISGKTVSIEDTTAAGIYNAKGNIDAISGLVIDSTGSHGINNMASMTVSGVTITNTGAEKNSVQNSGTLAISDATLKGSKNHGIYNTGTLSGKTVTIENATDNGIFNDKGTVKSINGLTIASAGSQGINNTGDFDASDVKISNPAKNGIYNSSGSAVVSGLNISNPGEHGVNNTANMTIADASISSPGKGSNGVQNKGTLQVNGLNIKDSQNHGIYNSSVMNATGKIAVTNTKQNGIFNDGGQASLGEVELTNTSDHGVNNAGKMEIKELSVTNAGGSGIQNSGNMAVTQKAVIATSGKHGVYNGMNFYGANICITNAGDLSLSNDGEMEIHGLSTSGKASKAIYNSGYAEIYGATIDGTGATHEYLVDNNGGVLDVTDTTIKNARGTAIHNRGNANTSVTNVVIDYAGNFGTFVEAGSSLSGDGLEINHVTKNPEIANSEGLAIKNAGTITMLDHVTLGGDDPKVTGSGVATVKEDLGNKNSALQMDAGTYSGYDLAIFNTTGNAVYNKGTMYVTDYTVDTSNYAMACRYNGWTTLSGDVSIKNTALNPIRTYGSADDKNDVTYCNGVTVTSGANMVIDGAGSHGITNKGSFLAAADSNITVKNITGTNINAINNAGIMTLGNVVIDNLHSQITMYNESTINSNSGNGLITSSELTANGAIEISNIYTLPENGKTDNSNGSGIVVKNGGSIRGDGSIAIHGNDGDGEYMGLYNGIFTMKCPIELTGDVAVDTASNQGIYIADANASLKAGNITASNIGGNSIWINNVTGKIQATGTITASYPAKGRGIYNSGTIEATNMIVSDLPGDQGAYAGIENNSNITVTGDVTIERVKNGPGIRNKGTFTVGDTLTIADVSGEKVNGIQQDSGKTMTLVNLNIANVTSTVAAGNYCNGIYNSGTIQLSGTAVISGILNSAATQDTEGAGIVNLGTITGTGSLAVDTAQRRGIYNSAGTIELAEIAVSDVGEIGIYMVNNGKVKATAISVDGTGTQGIQLQHANTLEADTLSIRNAPNNGLRLYNNNSNPKVKIGTFIAENCGQYAVAAAKSITNADVNISKLIWMNCGSGALHGYVNAGCVTTIEEGVSSAEGLEAAAFMAMNPIEGLPEGTGSEGTETEGTGSEGTETEGTGTEGTGSEGTETEGTGTEGTETEGTETEGTETEGTGSEGTETEETGTEGTEAEGAGTEGTGTEGTEMAETGTEER